MRYGVESQVPDPLFRIFESGDTVNEVEISALIRLCESANAQIECLAAIGQRKRKQIQVRIIRRCGRMHEQFSFEHCSQTHVS